uniref:Auto-transporter adhesin head GIN domain-containing protein n=1 Tax=Globisporangium ultimum (strain ATCC 200006 / CBS 805.95 / DAOM BR144) TaxID=431595 RepID=K3WY89_GLOUD
MHRMQHYALVAALVLGAVPRAHAADAPLTVSSMCAEAELAYADNKLDTLCKPPVVLPPMLIEPNATITINIQAPSLKIVAWPSNPLFRLVFTGASAKTTPELDVSAGFAQSTMLTALTFTNVNFKEPSVNLMVPNSLAYLKVASSNAKDVTLNGVTENAGLNKVGVNITSTGQPEELSAAEVAILKKNIGTSTASIEITAWLRRLILRQHP